MLLIALQKPVCLVFLMQVAMIIPTEACKENVITSCVNQNQKNKTTCVETYGEVYHALASDNNYFNIAQALYPAKKPSSVVVLVKLYGTNETEDCTPAAFMWSKSCLFAALPAKVLELLSLGSILVTSRTQELDVTIPPFCCHVPKDKREAIIDRVLVALQDLAVSPKIQNPQLNTVECVIKGHKPDISATGRSAYVRAMLWLSFIFSILSGPLIALVTLVMFKGENGNGNSDNRKNMQAKRKTLKWNSRFILFVEIGLLSTVCVFSNLGDAPWDIYVISSVIFIEGLFCGFFITKERFPDFKFLSDERVSGLQIAVFLCANLTVYHFCWLVIGVMVNALWGVTVLLFVCIFLAACIFPFYKYFRHTPSGQCSWKNCSLCVVFMLSVWSLASVVILAGQSFFGKETADDVVKTLTLYVTTAFASWMLSKKKALDKSSTPNQGEEEIPLTSSNPLTAPNPNS